MALASRGKRMAFRSLALAVSFALGFGVEHYRLHWRAEREQSRCALVQALAGIGIAADLALLKDERRERDELTFLEHLLEGNLEVAESLVKQGVGIEGPVPNLLDGLAKAQRYLEKLGNEQAALQARRLHATLAPPSATPKGQGEH